MERLRISEVARGARVGVQTIRYYERRGLLEEPPRTPSGYRQYPPDAVRRIRFIQRAQELGFALREIQELLDLRVDARTECTAVRDKTAAKIDEIKAKIADLQRMKRALRDLHDGCAGGGPARTCRILEALEPEPSS
ncbi:MAG: MerR family transcriptional regulator [Longimicrobiales bacterium]